LKIRKDVLQGRKYEESENNIQFEIVFATTSLEIHAFNKPCHQCDYNG